MTMVGITERGDAALDTAWLPWVKRGNPAILITKDPAKLLAILKSSDLSNPNIIIHCTITGWGGSILEPSVPSIDSSIPAYLDLASRSANGRVVLRIDPIIPTPAGLTRMHSVFKHRCTRLRISFLDNYPHVKARFLAAGIDPLPYDFHAPLETRRQIWEDLGKPEVCAEPGLPCSGCLSFMDIALFDIGLSYKRKGQRPECQCLAEKVELLKGEGPCAHNCLYCYWKRKDE